MTQDTAAQPPVAQDKAKGLNSKPTGRRTAKPQPTEKVAEKEAFKLWLAMPSWERVPQTQQDLAKVLHVDEGTLSDWKRTPGFKDEVSRLATEWARGFLPDVLGAMVHAAVDRLGGTAQDRKLFLQYVQDWAPKEATEHYLPAGTVIFTRSQDGGRKPKTDSAQTPSG